MKKRLFLQFGTERTDTPVLSTLTSQYGLAFNIYGATVNDECRFFAIELEGSPSDIEKALDFLRENCDQIEIQEDS